jgi:probable phosphoglycerate mutase
MNATRLIVIRHGETAWNVDTRIQGHTDIALNKTGLQQAARVADALRHETIDAIYSSDLQRAWQTASAVAHVTQAPLRAENGLRERNFGGFEGKTYAELEAEFPQDSLRWRHRDPDWAPPEGESLTNMRERITTTASRLAEQHLGGQIVLVAHGGVLDQLYRLATGQGVQASRTWQLGNAAINRLLWTPEGFTLVGWADVLHLEMDAIDEGSA